MLTRRDLFVTTAAMGAAVAITTPGSPSYALGSAHGDAVAETLRHMRGRARDLTAALDPLAAALSAGDRAGARRAYAAARAPYEEIEVLAAAFPDVDRAIDALPYHHAKGEADPDFCGFHCLEVRLFREDDPVMAARHLPDLRHSVQALNEVLDDSGRFTARGLARGAVALAGALAARKISGEEEIWSDLSLVVFRHNLLGIAAVVDPLMPAIEAENPAAAVAVRHSASAALAQLDMFFEGAIPQPYSALRMADRALISRAVYGHRDRLVAGLEPLGLLA